MNSTNCSTNKLRHFLNFVKVLLFFVELLWLEFGVLTFNYFLVFYLFLNALPVLRLV